MGKVQSTFINVFPGAISRSVDDVVITLANTGESAIKFGDPVFLDATNKGGKAWSNGAGMSTFVGFATRIGVKTPDTYGGNEGQYNPGDIMSVIVSGSVCVAVDSGTVAMGAPVYLNASTGKVTATSTDNTQLTNCQFRANVGANDCAEVVLTKRNIQ